MSAHAHHSCASIARFGALLIALWGATAAADRTIPDGFSKLREMSTKVDAVNRDFDALSGCVQIGSSDPAIPRDRIRLVAMPAGAEPVVLPIDARGCVTMPAALAAAAEDTPVTTNVPEGKASLGVTFSAKPPTTRELDYVQLQAGALQLNAAIRREAGVMRFMAPKIKGVLLLWKAPEPAEPGLRIREAAGERQLISTPAAGYHRDNIKLTDMTPGTRVLELPIDETLVRANPKVVLDVLPDLVIPLP